MYLNSKCYRWVLVVWKGNIQNKCDLVFFTLPCNSFRKQYSAEDYNFANGPQLEWKILENRALTEQIFLPFLCICSGQIYISKAFLHDFQFKSNLWFPVLMGLIGMKPGSAFWCLCISPGSTERSTNPCPLIVPIMRAECLVICGTGSSSVKRLLHTQNTKK